MDTGYLSPSPLKRLSTSLTSFWKLWVSLIGAIRQLDDNSNSMGEDGCEDLTDLNEKKKKNKKTSYLYTLMLTPRVWVVFSCLSEEDVSALRHGTVFIVIKTGFMTNNDGRLRGQCQDSVHPSRDYQVIMHAFFYTSLWGVHIIVAYILEFIMLESKIAKNTYVHTHHRHTWVL